MSSLNYILLFDTYCSTQDSFQFTSIQQHHEMLIIQNTSPAPTYPSFGMEGRETWVSYTNTQSSSTITPELTFRNHNVSQARSHGLLMALSFVVLLPLGAVARRTPLSRGGWVLHALIHTGPFILAVTSMTIGIGMVKSIVSLLSQHQSEAY